jgi:hypothetical protein
MRWLRFSGNGCSLNVYGVLDGLICERCVLMGPSGRVGSDVGAARAAIGTMSAARMQRNVFGLALHHHYSTKSVPCLWGVVRCPGNTKHYVGFGHEEYVRRVFQSTGLAEQDDGREPGRSEARLGADQALGLPPHPSDEVVRLQYGRPSMVRQAHHRRAQDAGAGRVQAASARGSVGASVGAAEGRAERNPGARRRQWFARGALGTAGLSFGGSRVTV